MQFELGSIVEGKVTTITGFGVFVELQNKQTGLVHISEISSSFVNDIRDFLEEGQVIKVKIIDLGKNGKLGLSIKQTIEQDESNKNTKSYGNVKPQKKKSFANRQKEAKEPKTPEQIEHDRFEDMISKFKKVSDDKMTTLKRNERSKQRRSGGAK